ncbi:TPA: ead/Ea22-like family protein [Escherichia coli]|nr:ead/Ea22-like family protein [Escherichia coli]HCN9052776.1 ead/Ea22-like family protein [Escherichia coli]
MSKIDYQALREAAEKATCGVWSLEYGEERFDAGDALIHREVVGYLPICRIEGAHPESGFDEDFQMEQQANAEFIAAANPATVLALLDELERNQQYIKSRDQENEEIALTVGKLRVELEAAKKRIAELEAEPVSQTYNLPELIEGMEVSIDVSTCDADLGNRYFGTVTEALELDTVKNGYILLVQDAEPNFDVNGNSPGIPDGWISCSDRMPVIGEINWRTSFPLLVTCEIGVIPAYYGFVRVNGNKHYGFMESLKYGDDSGNHPQTNEYDLISNVTHWMPLPAAPQQEVK